MDNINIKINEYFSEHLDKTIEYAEYLSSGLYPNDKKVFDRKNKIEKIMKRINK